MRLEEFYPLKGFKITEITRIPSGKVLIKAVSTSRSATFPYCQTSSHKRHSSYNRKPQALPCSDTPVQLVLSAQRYFCQDPDCTCKTYSERIPDTVSFYARRTTCYEKYLCRRCAEGCRDITTLWKELQQKGTVARGKVSPGICNAFENKLLFVQRTNWPGYS